MHRPGPGGRRPPGRIVAALRRGPRIVLRRRLDRLPPSDTSFPGNAVATPAVMRSPSTSNGQRTRSTFRGIQTTTTVTTIGEGKAGRSLSSRRAGRRSLPQESWPRPDRFLDPVLGDLFPGEETFAGKVVHVAQSRNPVPFEGQRVVVVGAGDSAAQIANELAAVANPGSATRHPIQFIPQRIGGHDIHYWFRETGFDTLPAPWLNMITDGAVVTDSVAFRQTLAEGRVDQRPMFEGLDEESVIWSDEPSEPVDAIILATGYSPEHGLPPRPRSAGRTRWPVASGRGLDDPPRTR